MKDSVVSQASRQFSIQITKDIALKKMLKRIEDNPECLMLRPDPVE